MDKRTLTVVSATLTGFSLGWVVSKYVTAKKMWADVEEEIRNGVALEVVKMNDEAYDILVKFAEPSPEPASDLHQDRDYTASYSTKGRKPEAVVTTNILSRDPGEDLYLVDHRTYAEDEPTALHELIAYRAGSSWVRHGNPWGFSWDLTEDDEPVTGPEYDDIVTWYTHYEESQGEGPRIQDLYIRDAKRGEYWNIVQSESEYTFDETEPAFDPGWDT